MERRQLFSAGIGLELNGDGTTPEGAYELAVTAGGDATTVGAGVTVTQGGVNIDWGDGTLLDTGVVPSVIGHNFDALGAPTDYTISGSAVVRVNTAVGGSGTVSDALVQPDGKRVTVGISGIGDWEIRRYNTNGTPDASFSGDGVVTLDLGGLDNARGVALCGTKLVVVGSASALSQFVVARFTGSGVLDTSFDGDGVATTGFGLGSAAVANSVAVQPDGKIVVGGSRTTSVDGTDFALARYLTDGSLDTTFGTGGTTATDVGGPGEI
jgi:uncharacterized delta-60 repeat protein